MAENKVHFPDTGDHVPEDKDQKILLTPYGHGMVIRSRRHPPFIQEIELTDWKQISTTSGPHRPAMLYSCQSFPSPPVKAGDDVLTLCGRGKVTELRDDGIAVILLSSWRLAGRSKVRCYLPAESLQVLRLKRIYEMSVYERVEHGQQLKQQATEFFRAKDFVKALQTYSQAVDAVRYVQHKKDSGNELRSDLLVLMITCYNNAGTCCKHLQQWDEAIQSSKNALILIEAMEKKKGKKIHHILQKEGTPDVKLFGEWKTKSYLITAHALLEKGETSETMEVLRKAHEAISEFTADIPAGNPSLKQLLANDKEVKKLHATCKERKKAQLKKEKLRAQAMFSSSSQEEEDEAEEVDQDETEVDVRLKDDTGAVSQTVGPSVTEYSYGEQVEVNIESNGGRVKAKKRVSFAQSVVEKDEAERRGRSQGSNDDELEWYEDVEVITGLAIFAGTVVATVAGLLYFLSPSKKS